MAQITKVHTAKIQGYHDRLVHTKEIADVPTISFFERPVVIASMIGLVGGIFGLVAQIHPDLSWAATIAGIFNLILTAYETVINSGSIVTQNGQTPQTDL